MTESQASLRKIYVVLAVLCTAALLIAYTGVRVARDVILERTTIDAAEQWAQVLSLTVSGSREEGETRLVPDVTRKGLEQTIYDDVLLWYRIYDGSGAVIYAADPQGARSLLPEIMAHLESETIFTRGRVLDQSGNESITTAEAYHVIQDNTDVARYIGVRVSRADAIPVVERNLNFAFAGSCAIILVLTWLGFIFLKRYLHRQQRLEDELRQINEELLQSEAVASVGHWSAPSADIPAQWSPEMYVIFGRDPETFIPKNATVLSCYLPEERKRFQDAVDEMVETGNAMEFESRIQRPDGQVRHVFQRGSVKTDAEGRITQLFGVVQDITERKEMELELAFNTERIDRAVEASGAAIWDWDIATGDLSMSPKLAEILGYETADWKPTAALHEELCHPDDLERVLNAFRDHFKGLAPYDIEYRVRRTDGAYVWIHSRGRAIWDENGTAIRIIGTVTDITQRREQQEEQRRKEETLNLAIEAAGAGFYDRVWGEEKIYWSPRLRQMLGITDDSFQPTVKSFNALVHPDDLEPLVRDVKQLQEKGQSVVSEYRVKHSNGRWVWVQLHAKIYRDEDGTPERSVGFIIDITDRKEAELEATRGREKLELALEASQAGYFDHDWTTDKAEWSSRVYDILGFDRSFVPQGNTFNSLIHSDDIGVFEAGTRTMREESTPLDAEVRVRHGDGRYIWVQVKANAYRDDEGNIERTIGFVTDISERKRIEKELEASKELFEDVATAAGEYIWEFDRQGIFTFVSERVESVLGVPPDEVIGRSPLSFMEPDEALVLQSSFLKTMVSKVPFKGLQVPGLRPDGSIVWQQLSGTPSFDADGRLTGYRGVSTDITAQKLAEQALVRSEEKFRDLIQGSIQGLIIHRKYKPLFVNDAYAHMLGFDSAEDLKAESESMLDFLSEDFRSRADVFWDRNMSKEPDDRPVVGRMVDRHGNLIYTEVVSRKVEWDGEPALQNTVVDVTDRYRSQQALEESEERFRVVAENAADLITIRGADGALTYASPSALAITGYTPDELVNAPEGSVTYEDDTTKVEERRRQNAGEGGIVTAPLLWRLRRKDGQVIWLETTSTRLPAADGQTQERVMSMSRDVTDRVERERELEAAQDRLTRQAQELTELAERLEQERERAEEANIAKSQFLAKMSHELRTPMTGVLGMVDLLNQTAVTESQSDMLSALHRSAMSLLELLNDILDVSKIEAGELVIESIDFKLSSVLRDVRELFQPALSAKGLKLSVNVEEGVQDVLKGDPTRFRQVLMNLIGNANKFTEKGGVTVTVSQLSDYSDGLTLRVDVADTGVGIAPEDQSRLFQAFVQAEDSTTRKYGGTGLGLAICEQLVEAMGGMIWVDSDLGKGSTFSFTVNVAAGDEAAIQDGATVSYEDKEQALRPLRILVAEDNETTQMLLKTMLERNGHTVEAVDNGQKAVAAAEDATFDIVLMDMQMPVMDGPEAMRTIRAMNNGMASRPIIALTADAIRDHRKRYLDAGANVVVTKPVNWPILFGEMARLTSQQRPAPGPQVADYDAVQESSPVNDVAGQDNHPYGEHLVLDGTMLEALEEALDRETLMPMVVTFQKNMDKYVLELGELVENGDLTRTKRTAHALKGLAAQFGASRVSAIAKDIEDSIEDLDDVKAVLPILQSSIHDTKIVLEDRL